MNSWKLETGDWRLEIGLLASDEDFLQDGVGFGAAHPDNADPSLADGGGNGSDGVIQTEYFHVLPHFP